jgi:hypothetical protein
VAQKESILGDSISVIQKVSLVYKLPEEFWPGVRNIWKVFLALIIENI